MKRNVVRTGEVERFRRANFGELGVNGGGVDLVGAFAEESEQDGAVGTVAAAGEGEGAVEVDLDAMGGAQQFGVVEGEVI